MYDLTKTNFEGDAAGNSSAMHGHSKGKHTDCPLVILRRNCKRRWVHSPIQNWLGPIFNSRPIEGTPRNITVSRKYQYWFISIQTERKVADPIHPSSSSAGGDRGVKRFMTLSDGTFYESLDAFPQGRKAACQGTMEAHPQTKKSRNWYKQKTRITNLHIKIADARKDYPHKVSNQVSKNHAVVVLEDLKVANMSKSAKGTPEESGAQRQGPQESRDKGAPQGAISTRNRASIRPFWIRAGASFAARLNISKHGEAVGCCWSIPPNMEGGKSSKAKGKAPAIKILRRKQRGIFLFRMAQAVDQLPRGK
jgi:hypothetical protein